MYTKADFQYEYSNGHQFCIALYMHLDINVLKHKKKHTVMYQMHTRRKFHI